MKPGNVLLTFYTTAGSSVSGFAEEAALVMGHLVLLVLLASSQWPWFCMHAMAQVPSCPKPSAPEYTPQTLAIGNGVELSYIDSGAVQAVPSNASYTTIFAIHGEAYYSPVFARVMTLASSYSFRFVAVTRRDYPGSTPYSTAELAVLTNGTAVEKAKFMTARGVEIATFIDNFIRLYNLPGVSDDGRNGGIAVLGWSLGNAFSIATIASVPTLPADIKQRLAMYTRALIMQEPPSISIGTYLPPQSWSPQIDTSIPVADHQPAFVQWITSYFQHGNLSTRNPDVLQYVLPATFRVPSVFNMSPTQLADMTYLPPASGSDALISANVQPQLNADYENACYNTSVRSALPSMDIWELCGNTTANFGIVAFWSIQDDDNAHGGGFVNFQWIGDVNHFIHWDKPELALAAYQEALS